MLKIALASFLSTISLMECNNIAAGGNQKSPSPQTAQVAKPHAREQPRANEVKVPSDTKITLERTICFGVCPSYKVTLTADGKITYEGRAQVKRQGSAADTTTQAEVARLLAAFEKANYSSLRDIYGGDECPEFLTDHPTVITSLTMNGKTKAVSHYHGCYGLEELKGLGQLEAMIDEVAKTAQWIGNPGERNQSDAADR